MTTDEEKLWEWASRMDEASVSEFATGIVGIGALFFAYGQVPFAHTGMLIALIGLGGSIILWMHLYAARKEYRAIRKELGKDSFIRRVDDLQAWRKKGRDRVLYYPVSRLMTYFMGLVSWAWIAILLRRLNWFSFGDLVLVSIGLMLIAFALAIWRQVQDMKRKTY